MPRRESVLFERCRVPAFERCGKPQHADNRVCDDTWWDGALILNILHLLLLRMTRRRRFSNRARAVLYMVFQIKYGAGRRRMVLLDKTNNEKYDTSRRTEPCHNEKYDTARRTEPCWEIKEVLHEKFTAQFNEPLRGDIYKYNRGRKRSIWWDEGFGGRHF